MIDELRAKLQQANWARAGLGMPLLSELNSTAATYKLSHKDVPNTTHKSIQSVRSSTGNDVDMVHQPCHEPANRSHTATPEVALEIDSAAYSGTKQQVTFTSRKKYAGAPEFDMQPLLTKSNDGDVDSEHNKYKRRPAREWLRRIWK
ncbi:hypothetical protein DICVIV_01530 [Dictyocaulus viviparus]|uniref:Uncharacterized protein n=1 Tax=Dictyocaulus viviparus TaxID=29172 RepID=A0A0D8Y655_DICVI|nr:hypothetical protein DICVIV_01530 [Dictyocaulus viviparus]